MSLPSLEKLWTDPVTKMAIPQIHSTLGGDLINSSINYGCVRVSHALHSNGAPITVHTDFQDKNGYSYIVTTRALKNYLVRKYGSPRNVRRNSALGKKGIIVFDCKLKNAEGEIFFLIVSHLIIYQTINYKKECQKTC